MYTFAVTVLKIMLSEIFKEMGECLYYYKKQVTKQYA